MVNQAIPIIETEATDETYVGMKQAMAVLGCANSKVQRLVVLREVRVILPPGRPAQYCLSDLRRIKAQTKAKAAAS